MRALQLTKGSESRINEHTANLSRQFTGGRKECVHYEFPASVNREARSADPRSPYRAGDFLERLSKAAMEDFESLAQYRSCPSRTVLFREDELPTGTLVLIEGRVKLSMNSADGRRLIVGTACPGEILGLTSAISGCQYEITGEAFYRCEVALLSRQSFLDFLFRHPAAFQNMARELSLDKKRTSEQVRTLGLALTSQAKLARLLLDWCANKNSGPVAYIQCPFSHVEIGQHIGLSRETVTRCLTDFKNQGLVKQRGSTFIVPNLRSLANYAGQS
jgi:CRP-like cAMP-binding protein